MKIAWFNKASTEKRPVGTVEERLDRIEAAQRALGLEWEDTYERVMRALRRLNKRARDQEARDEREEAKNAQEAAGEAISEFPGVDPISAKILARRARVPSRPNGTG